MSLFVEVLGWMATIAVLVSFFFKDMVKLRLVNFSAAVLWTVYGILKSDSPIIGVNVSVMIIHIIWFYKNKKQWRS